MVHSLLFSLLGLQIPYTLDSTSIQPQPPVSASSAEPTGVQRSNAITRPDQTCFNITRYEFSIIEVWLRETTNLPPTPVSTPGLPFVNIANVPPSPPQNPPTTGDSIAAQNSAMVRRSVPLNFPSFYHRWYGIGFGRYVPPPPV
jgi:hypothetical protein